MSDNASVLNQIEQQNIQYVNFRFTDPRGKWQHLSYHSSAVDADLLSQGIMFDGSSIAGWKDINESDMLLTPRAETAVIDPFADKSTLILICDVREPSTGEHYERGPRGVAKRAEEYLIETGIGDTAYFGPEPEFFVLDSVRFRVEGNRSFYEIDSKEGPYNSGTDYEEGNLGHRPRVKGGYFPVAPVDHGTGMRDEMMSVLVDMGVRVEKHHHECTTSPRRSARPRPSCQSP
jgi:glutamine synthetase